MSFMSQNFLLVGFIVRHAQYLAEQSPTMRILSNNLPCLCSTNLFATSASYIYTLTTNMMTSLVTQLWA